LILQDLHSYDSKGFVNDTNLNKIPILSEFLELYAKKESRYILGDKLRTTYK